VRGADNLTTFMPRLSWNLGYSASWNTQSISRPVMGLLYLLQSMMEWRVAGRIQNAKERLRFLSYSYNWH